MCLENVICFITNDTNKVNKWFLNFEEEENGNVKHTKILLAELVNQRGCLDVGQETSQSHDLKHL